MGGREGAPASRAYAVQSARIGRAQRLVVYVTVAVVRLCTYPVDRRIGLQEASDPGIVDAADAHLFRPYLIRGQTSAAYSIGQTSDSSSNPLRSTMSSALSTVTFNGTDTLGT
jgi:hypothetical protein